MKKYELKKLEDKAHEIRKSVLDMCMNAGTGHITSSFSCAEILTALYHGGILNHDPKNPELENRDRFILSKGQASPILYAVLSDRGYFPQEWLSSFNKKNGKFGVHLQEDIPGVEYTTGSLGVGLSIGTGVALTAKMNEKDYRTFVLLGDAELQEGSNNEAFRFASQHKLNNLIAIIDRNGYGVLGSTEESVGLNPLEKRIESCGWAVKKIDGHSIAEIKNSIQEYKNSSKPLAIVAYTVKGKGIKFMEGGNLKEGLSTWHGLVPIGEYALRAKKELNKYINDKNA